MSDCRPNQPDASRAFTLVVLVLCVLIAVLRVVRLEVPGTIYFDEHHYVNAARDYLQGIEDRNFSHPPLAKLFIAESIELFGDRPAVWRIPSCICGVASMFLGGAMAWRLTGRKRVTLLTALLIGMDFLSHVQSRIATLDALTAFWIYLALLFGAINLTRQRPTLMLDLATGLSLGVANGCKWSGAFAAAALVGAHIWMSGDWRRCMRLSTIYGVCILCIYALSYLPWFAREGLNVDSIVRYHEIMWRYRQNQGPKKLEFLYLSEFYSWPLVTRPCYYYNKVRGDQMRCVVALGNPLFWCFSFFLIADSLAQAKGRQDQATRFLASTILIQWLIWGLCGSGGVIFYMLPMIPCMAIIVAQELDRWWSSSRSRKWALAYLFSLLLLFLVYLPTLMALTIPVKYWELLYWIPSWR